MKYIIDTDTMKITKMEEAEKAEASEKRQIKMLNLLRLYQGHKEWDGVVCGIQKWYYGYVSKTSWCATTISFLLSAVGISVRRENVKNLLDYAEVSKIGKVYTRNDFKIGMCKEIKEGDILFFLWDGDTMTTGSKKHVSMCNETTTGDKIKCLGGNQADAISEQIYDRSKLYAIWRIDY